MKVGTVTIKSVRGQRHHQEDRFFEIHLGIRNTGPHLFGVFDGHGGEFAAEECRRLIPSFAHLYSSSRPAKVILRNILQKLEKLTQDIFSQGCTASLALVRPRQNDVWVAVIGDSPVVVVDKDGVISLSPLHNVGLNQRERLLAESRGGKYLDIRGTGYIARGFSSGYIQLSRSLGDNEFGDVVSKEPEIFQVKNPRHVVVATDGILEDLLDYKDPDFFVDTLLSGATVSDFFKGLNPHDNLTIAYWTNS